LSRWLTAGPAPNRAVRSMIPAHELTIQKCRDTAYWVAYHRALETARNDALFRDPFAAKLAGERGRRCRKDADFPASCMDGALRTPNHRRIHRCRQSAAASEAVLSSAPGSTRAPYRMTLPASFAGSSRLSRGDRVQRVPARGREAALPAGAGQNRPGDRSERQKLLARVNTTVGQNSRAHRRVVPYLATTRLDRSRTSCAQWTARGLDSRLPFRTGTEYRRRRNSAARWRMHHSNLRPADWSHSQAARLAGERDPVFPGRGAKTWRRMPFPRFCC